MIPMRPTLVGVLICALVVIQVATIRVTASPPEVAEAQRKGEAETATGKQPRITIDMARDRAEYMHEMYEATLEMLHHRYFHRDRSLLPARAMEDIFTSVKQRTNVQARWISVNTKAMNIDHEPKSDFEKQAAEAITKGKPAFEAVQDDVYLRATAIPLKASCVGCHAGAFAAASKTPRFAGLVISVPLKRE